MKDIELEMSRELMRSVFIAKYQQKDDCQFLHNCDSIECECLFC